MTTTPPDLSSKTIPELMKIASDVMGAQYMTGTRPLTELATTMLQFRFSEKQTEALIQQAKTSERLVTATHDLAVFTHALARATWALFSSVELPSCSLLSRS
jgi:hypothetical protein